MPCYTQVSVEVKNESIAKAILKKHNWRATVNKNRNGTFTVSSTDTRFNEGVFRQEYATEVAKAQAKKAGYTITQKEENGETVLILRQY